MCTDVGCLNHKQYNGSQFSTYRKLGFELDVQFGTGELVGEINADTVYVAGIKVENQNFAEITQQIGSIFAEVTLIGICFIVSLDLMALLV